MSTRNLFLKIPNCSRVSVLNRDFRKSSSGGQPTGNKNTDTRIKDDFFKVSDFVNALEKDPNWRKIQELYEEALRKTQIENNRKSSKKETSTKFCQLLDSNNFLFNNNFSKNYWLCVQCKSFHTNASTFWRKRDLDRSKKISARTQQDYLNLISSVFSINKIKLPLNKVMTKATTNSLPQLQQQKKSKSVEQWVKTVNRRVVDNIHNRFKGSVLREGTVSLYIRRMEKMAEKNRDPPELYNMLANIFIKINRITVFMNRQMEKFNILKRFKGKKKDIPPEALNEGWRPLFDSAYKEEVNSKLKQPTTSKTTYKQTERNAGETETPVIKFSQLNKITAGQNQTLSEVQYVQPKQNINTGNEKKVIDEEVLNKTMCGVEGKEQKNVDKKELTDLQKLFSKKKSPIVGKDTEQLSDCNFIKESSTTSTMDALQKPIFTNFQPVEPKPTSDTVTINNEENTSVIRETDELDINRPFEDSIYYSKISDAEYERRREQMDILNDVCRSLLIGNDFKFDPVLSQAIATQLKLLQPTLYPEMQTDDVAKKHILKMDGKSNEPEPRPNETKSNERRKETTILQRQCAITNDEMNTPMREMKKADKESAKEGKDKDDTDQMVSTHEPGIFMYEQQSNENNASEKETEIVEITYKNYVGDENLLKLKNDDQQQVDQMYQMICKKLNINPSTGRSISANKNFDVNEVMVSKLEPPAVKLVQQAHYKNANVSILQNPSHFANQTAANRFVQYNNVNLTLKTIGAPNQSKIESIIIEVLDDVNNPSTEKKKDDIVNQSNIDTASSSSSSSSSSSTSPPTTQIIL